MKFTDGQWLLQPGVSAHYATETHAVDIHDDRVVLLVPTRPIKHRGDTLQGPTLTVTLRSPLPGVIRVSVEHFSASQAPRLHVPMVGADPQRLQITETDQLLTVTSGPLSVDVKKGEGYGLVFREGDKVLTRSDWRSLGYVQWAGKANYVHEQLTLAVGEYDLRPGRALHPVGEERPDGREHLASDGGTASEQAYKNVPFYLTSRGYGVLVDQPGRGVLRGRLRRRPPACSSAVEGETLDYCVIDGSHAQGRRPRRLHRARPAARRCRRPGPSACG